MRVTAVLRGVAVIAVLASGAFDAPTAAAGSVSHVLVSITGQSGLADVSQVSGGQVVPAQTVPAHDGMPALTTASYTTPLVITSSDASWLLLRAAALYLQSPLYAPMQVEAKWLNLDDPAGVKLAQVGHYLNTTVTRVDFPANYGAHGPFVVTASVEKSDSQPGNRQIVPWSIADGLPPGAKPISTLVWSLSIHGLPNLPSASPAPPLTYDGFSLSPASINGGVSLTIHGALANYDIAKWSQANPSTFASIDWRLLDPSAPGGSRLLYDIQLTGVALTGSAPDAPRIAGAAPTTFTAHLSSQHVAIVNGT